MAYRVKLLGLVPPEQMGRFLTEVKDEDFCKILSCKLENLPEELLKLEDGVLTSLINLVMSQKTVLQVPATFEPPTNSYGSLLNDPAISEKSLIEQTTKKSLVEKVFKEEIFGSDLADFKGIEKKDLPQRILLYINQIKKTRKNGEVYYYIEALPLCQTFSCIEDDEESYDHEIMEIELDEKGRFVKQAQRKAIVETFLSDEGKGNFWTYGYDEEKANGNRLNEELREALPNHFSITCFKPLQEKIRNHAIDVSGHSGLFVYIMPTTDKGHEHNLYMNNARTDNYTFKLADVEIPNLDQKALQPSIFKKSYFEMDKMEIERVENALKAVMKFLDRNGDNFLDKNVKTYVDSLRKTGKLPEGAANHFAKRKEAKTKKFRGFGKKPYAQSDKTNEQ